MTGGNEDAGHRDGLRTLIYRFAAFEVDDAEFRLTEAGASVPLEPKALRLLLYLVKNPGRLVGKQELLDSVWRDASVGENALTRSVTLLRKALGDSSRSPRFLETVPTVGYRFIGIVACVDTTVVEPPAGEAAGTSRTGWRPSGRVAALLVCGALAATALGWRVERGAWERKEIHTIAVLPLENLSGDAAQDYLADGTTDELITELAQIPAVRVVSRSSSIQEKGSHKPLRQLAAELGADAIVEGSVALSGGRVRINATLVDARTDSHLWSSSFEGSKTDIVTLEDAAAREIASHARLAAIPGAGGAGRSRPVDPEAHDAYLRGLYLYDRRDAVESARYFQRAIDLDPLYSSAYAGLAEALNSEGLLQIIPPDEVIPKAVAAAGKAIELDSENGEAYIALGTVQQSFVWDWNAAGSNLLHGIDLSPNNSPGLTMYAIHLDSMDKTEEAIAYMRRARDNDPLSFFSERMYGSVLYYGRHYDEAIEQLRKLEQAQPGQARVIENWIAWSYEKKGMHDEAVAYDLSEVERMSPKTDIAALRAEYKRDGWHRYWQARLKATDTRSVRGCGLYDLGVMYTRTGDRDRAISTLKEAARQRCFWMSTARVDPLLDDLRGDPRFVEVLRAANWPPESMR